MQTNDQQSQVSPATPPPEPVSDIPNSNAPQKICESCGYEGAQPVCSHCGIPMAEKCLNCNRSKSECVCFLNKNT